MASQHIIHNIKLNLHLESNTDSLEEANSIVDDYKSALLGVIASFFDKFQIKENILIEELHFTITNAFTLDELKEKLFEKLETKFSKYLSNVSLPISANISEGVHDATSNEEIVLDELRINNILYFLAWGQFEWDHQTNLFNEFLNSSKYLTILKQYLLESDVLVVFAFFNSYPFAIFRLFHYFPQVEDVFLSLLIPASYKVNIPAFIYIKKHVRYQINHLQSSSSRAEILSFLRVLSSFHNTDSSSSELLISCFIIDNTDDSYTFGHLKDSVVSLSISRVFAKEFLLNITVQLNKLFSIRLTEQELSKVINQFKISNLEVESIIADNKTQISKTLMSDSESYVNYKYCGVVFLHPYLAKLFKRLGLIVGNTFINMSGRIKAAQILFYLSNSYRKATEEDFNFFKLILEIDKDVFVPVVFEITELEKTVCLGLWKDLIKDWSILKSTTIETLQRNFIARNGTVKMEKKTMDLYLEKSTFDILLEHYPYNYSLIKLSWLNKLICVII